MRKVQAQALVVAIVAGFAIAPASAQEQSAAPIECSGNEPFWRFETGADEGFLSRLGENGTEERRFAGQMIRLDWLMPGWHVWRGTAVDDETAVLVATLRAEACVDSMAGEEAGSFDYRVVLSLPEPPALTGCCRVLKSDGTETAAATIDIGEAQDVDWSRHLADLVPAIRRCAADAPVEVDRVTGAWPMNHGMALVRLRGALPGYYDCVATMVGDGIDRFEPASTLMPNDGEPTLYLDPDTLLEYGETETVYDGNGKIVGLLNRDGWTVTPVALTEPDAVYGRLWLVLTIGGKPVTDDIDSPIQFNPMGTVTGRTGCNRMSGQAILGDGTIQVGPLASTQMACQEAVMAHEKAFVDALVASRRWLIENGNLYLLREDGTELAKFAPGS